MNKKLYLLLSLFFLSVLGAKAQGSLDIHFNGFSFLDNREYKAFTERSRTYSGTRTQLDLGVNLDSTNHFIVGVNGIHEYGAQPYFLKVNPVAYYSHESHKWLFNAGMFPRDGLVTQIPRAMFNDTLLYYRPNIEGLLTRYQTKYGYQTLFIDWVSRQTAVDREQFIFGMLGKYLPNPTGPFYLMNYFTMLHDAGPAVSIPGDHIRDNGAAQIRGGLNFKQSLFDSLSVEAGGMISLERTRVNDGGGFKIPKGFVASVYAGLHRFAFFDEFYAGQGHHVTYGDAFYEKKMYNRLDVIYSPFLFKGITGQFVLSLMQSPGQLGDSQEAFRLKYDIGRKKLVSFKTTD